MNKKNKSIQRWIRAENQMNVISTKAPRTYMLFLSFLFFIAILVVIGILFNNYQKMRVIPFEVEGSCNTGFIGIDFKTEFDNQPYSVLDRIYDGSNPQDFRLVKHIYYFREPLMKHINLKNIDGLNCNFKVKGAIPLNKL